MANFTDIYLKIRRKDMKDLRLPRAKQKKTMTIAWIYPDNARKMRTLKVMTGTSIKELANEIISDYFKMYPVANRVA